MFFFRGVGGGSDVDLARKYIKVEKGIHINQLVR